MGGVTLKRWDVADYLHTEEDMALYLGACLEEDPGDGSLLHAALRDIVRAKGRSRSDGDTGQAWEGISQALSVEGNLEFAAVMKVIKALGLKLHVEPAT